ncbi:MAG: sarcosine oxidase subunit gamma family protein [Caulobacter sp.]|nr:sarcosine oxidase subunit gamma family protein [Caulobacter sp.]
MAEIAPFAAVPRLSHDLCSVRPGSPCARLAVRAAPAARDIVSRRLGVTLPDMPMTSAMADSRCALWLGPDEWLVLDWRDRAVGAVRPAADAAADNVSVVDVSDRQVAIIVEGEAAADLVNADSPLDLSLRAFPKGAVARTVFGRTEVIVWRQARDLFHLEVMRSFADYVWRILELAHADITSDPGTLTSSPDPVRPTRRP